MLLDIIMCEQDLTSHCMIEDDLFVPAVRLIEQNLKNSSQILYADKTADDAEDTSGTLTSREKEIIICLTKGLNNKEIADYLFLSPHTVATHRRNISNKLQIHTIAGLIIYAIANKLIKIEEVS